MTFGKNFLSAVIAKNAVTELLHGASIKHLFKGSEVALFEFVLAHVKKYGSVPDVATVLAHTDEELPNAVEPASYYRDLMEQRHVELELKKSMLKAQDELKAHAPKEALGTIAETVMQLVRESYGVSVVDFRQAYDLLMSVYVSQKQGIKGLQFGWPTLDAMTGGMLPGDLISFVGRPALGKTWQMLYGCHHGWLQSELDPKEPGSSRMFVSMEMGSVPIQQRLLSMHLSIPAFKIKNGLLTTISDGGGTLGKFKKGLKKLQGFKAPFWIVDGNLTSTVDDVEALARQLKPDAIFIDGAYLLQHAKAKDRYARVAENLDLLKKNVASIAPTVCSWQFNRGATKKKKEGEDPDLEDIGYSDAIGQHSSLVLGLFEADSVETLKMRRVKVLKGRSGETGEFTTKFRFDTMDFSEVAETSVEHLQFK